MYPLCQIALPEEGGEVFHIRSGNPGNASVMHQKTFFRLLSDPLDPGQGGFYLALAPEAAVECDSETVSLVANPLQELQCRGVAVNEERIRVSHPDDLLKALGQADHCKLLSKTKLSQCLKGKVELSLASVNDN